MTSSKGSGQKCEQGYCLYNKNRECLLEKISIDELGMCDDCIIVSLEEEFLEAEKERQLAEIESRWEEPGD